LVLYPLLQPSRLSVEVTLTLASGPYVLSWEDRGGIDCQGSYPVARAFEVAFTSLMFPLSDKWGISVFGVIVSLVTPVGCLEH
jgi:hypothetical protein